MDTYGHYVNNTILLSIKSFLAKGVGVVSNRVKITLLSKLLNQPFLKIPKVLVTSSVAIFLNNKKEFTLHIYFHEV